MLSSGQAATTTALLGAAEGGRRGRLQLGDLRRHAAPARRSAAEVRHLVALRVDRGAAPTPETVISDATKLVWFESPINPTLRCVDVAAVAAACRARGVMSVIDNTFASPINQRPIALGVDLVMHSATKYLNGHSDVTAGVLVGPARADRRRSRRRAGWSAASSIRTPAYALGRGLKTLAVRVAASQRQRAWRWPSGCRRDRRVEHGLLPGSRVAPDHAIARRQMRGFGGMVCVDLGGRLRACVALLRSPAGDQARREPRRRREPVQPAGADVAVGTLDEELARAGVTAGHGAAVDRAGGSGRPDRGSRSGAGLGSAAYRGDRATSAPVLSSCRRRLVEELLGHVGDPRGQRPAPSRSPNFCRKRSIGTTALAIARWPPALPMSPNQRFTNSPALRE